MSAALDRWLPDFHIRTRHRRESTATPDVLWAAAQDLRLHDTRTLGRLVRWRIPDTPADLRFTELFATYPFCVLEEGDGWSVSGLCGRIWTLHRDYPRLGGPADFTSWDVGDTVRVAFCHWVEPTAHGSAIVSEARVQPLGRRAAVRLRSLWLVVGVFERLIGAEPLLLAVQRAERAPVT